MLGIDLKTVLAEIDATAWVESGRQIAIRYVSKDGNIRPMIISKRRPMRSVDSQLEAKRPKAKPHFKNNYLIPVIDHTDHDKAKDLFAGGIIGFNPEPDIEKFFPIIRNDGSKTE